MRVRVLLPTILAAACWAETAPVTGGPAAEIRLADGPTLVEHWNGSIYATVWADPAMAQAREALAAASADAAKKLGFDPLQVLPQARGARLALVGMDKTEFGQPRPSLIASVDLGALAEPVMKLALDQGGEATSVPGADQALIPKKSGTDGQTGVLARFGTSIVLALNAAAVKPGAAQAVPADLHLTATLEPLLAMIKGALTAEQAAAFDSAVANNPAYKGTWDYRATIVPEGVREHLTQDHAQPGTVPVDRAVLTRLPATSLLVVGIGLDGKAMWKANREAWLMQAAGEMSKAQGTEVSPDEAEETINVQLSQFGVQSTLQELVEGFSGTTVLAVGQGVPFPTATLALPRSPQIDDLVELLLGMLQAEPPAEGESTMLPIPNLPVAVNLIRDAKHWVVSSDPGVSASWAAGEPGGWAESPAGKLALEHAPANSVMIGSSDTPGVIRTIGGYVNMLLGMQPNLDAAQKQGIQQALSRLGTKAACGYLWCTVDGGRSEMESRGLLGFIGIPVISGAAGAVFAMQAQQARRGDGAAITLLRSQVLPAQVQFQAGGYIDQDGDGIGEYGFADELDGSRPVGEDLTLTLLDQHSVEGWRLAIHLPDGKGGVKESPADEGVRPSDTEAADQQERMWVAYAWPAEGNESKKVFAMTQDGSVRSAAYEGAPPEPLAVFGGAEWTADVQPTWQVVPRRR